METNNISVLQESMVHRRNSKNLIPTFEQYSTDNYDTMLDTNVHRQSEKRWYATRTNDSYIQRIMHSRRFNPLQIEKRENETRKANSEYNFTRFSDKCTALQSLIKFGDLPKNLKPKRNVQRRKPPVPLSDELSMNWSYEEVQERSPSTTRSISMEEVLPMEIELERRNNRAPCDDESNEKMNYASIVQKCASSLREKLRERNELGYELDMDWSSEETQNEHSSSTSNLHRRTSPTPGTSMEM